MQESAKGRGPTISVFTSKARWERAKQFGAMGPKDSKMRSNAMKTCAAGAMLFGGTLGAAQQAAAGVVWKDAFSYTGLNSQQTATYLVTQDSSMNLSLSGANRTSAGVPPMASQFVIKYGSDVQGAYGVSVTLNSYASGSGPTYTITKSAATSTGFSATMDFQPNPLPSKTSYARMAVEQAFDVTAGTTVDFRLSLSAPNMVMTGNNSRRVELWKVVSAENEDYPTAEYTVNLFDPTSAGAIPTPDPASSVTNFTLGEGRYKLVTSYYMTGNSSSSGTLVDFAIVPAPGAAALIGLAGLVTGRRRKA